MPRNTVETTFVSGKPVAASMRPRRNAAEYFAGSYTGRALVLWLQ